MGGSGSDFGCHMFGVLEIRELRLLWIWELRGDGALIGGGEAHGRLDGCGLQIDGGGDRELQRRDLLLVRVRLFDVLMPGAEDVGGAFLHRLAGLAHDGLDERVHPVFLYGVDFRHWC